MTVQFSLIRCKIRWKILGVVLLMAASLMLSTTLFVMLANAATWCCNRDVSCNGAHGFEESEGSVAGQSKGNGRATLYSTCG
eukprot:6196013-Pyramimonas_sp.AAC.1